MCSVGMNTSRSNIGKLLYASTMIFYLGFGLSIIKLTEILNKMQCSGPFSDCVFYIDAGWNGGVCVRTQGGEVFVNLEKSVFDSWPFIPDHTLYHLHTNLEISKRWGLDIHTLKSFKVVSVSEKSEVDKKKMKQILQHLQTFAVFSEFRVIVRKTRRNAEMCVKSSS